MRFAFLLLIFVVSGICPVGLPVVDSVQADTTKILFLAGARSHGSGEHEFKAGCMLLAKALNEQSGLDIKATVISGWPKDESVFDGVDAVIIYSDGTKVIKNGWEKPTRWSSPAAALCSCTTRFTPAPKKAKSTFGPGLAVRWKPAIQSTRTGWLI